MRNIEAIKHVVCYDQKDFITQLIQTTKIMEDDGLEVDIQYSQDREIYTALIIGRKTEVVNADKNVMCSVLESNGRNTTQKVQNSKQKPKQN